MLIVHRCPALQETPGVPTTPATIKARKPARMNNVLGRQSAASPAISSPIRHNRRPRRQVVQRPPFVERMSSPAPFDFSSTEESTTEGADAKLRQTSDDTKLEQEPTIPVRRRARHARRESFFAALENHEEQVVPALANAEKKQERRRSLLASSRMSVRKASPEPKESDDSMDELELLASPESKQGKRGSFAAESDAEIADVTPRPSSSTADRIETLLTQFELETGTVLTTFRQMIRRTEQEDEERKASKRKQHDDRAEALQQISDMADDVKQYMDSLEAEAAERESRLQEMLKIVSRISALVMPSDRGSQRYPRA